MFMKLNTRLQLRYDLLSAWAAVPADKEVQLLAGEVAIGRKDDGDLVIKVGNGQGTDSVWSKLPTINVTPTDFNALKTFVGTLPEGTDDTTVIGYVDALNGAMDKRVDALEAALGEGEGTVKAQIEAALNAAKAYTDAKIGALGEGETVVDLISAEKTARENADTAINNKIGTAADAATAETVYGAIAAEKARAEAAELAINNKIGTVAEDKTVAQLIADEATTARAAEQANATAIGEETTRATNAETALGKRIDAHEELVGKLPEEGTKATTIVGYIDEKVAAINTNAGDLADRVKAIEDDYLVEADKTELSNAIAAEKTRAEGAEANLQTQINTIMNNPDTEGVINSINEFTQYIADHGEIAEGFRTDIDKNKEDIAANAKAITDQAASDAATYETKTDATAKLTEAKSYTDTEVAKEEKRAIAKEGELAQAIEDAKKAAADADVVVLANAQKYTDEEVKKLADGAVKANADAIALINNADTGILAQAKTYANGLDSAMNTRVAALETTVGKAAEGENAATGLVKAVADNAAAIAAINNGADGVLAKAKAYTDELANGAVKNNADAIATINSTTDGILVKAKAYTDQEVGKLAATVATTEKLGLVKASDTVAVAADGKMSVAKVSTDVLVQGTQEVILHGGNATGYGA
jgi:hypothetical protein